MLALHGPSIGIGAGITVAVIIVIFFSMHGLDAIKADNKIQNSDMSSDSEQELILLPSLSDSIQGNAPPPQESLISITTLIGNGSPILGDESAPIMLVEFGDYQCHFCNVFFHDTKDRITDGYVKPGKVQMIFKDYHIIGPDSVDASHGAHCAGDQGLFWEYHDILYENWAGENTGWAEYANLESFAAGITDLDLDTWIQCMIDKPHSSRILASNNDARALGLTGTPSFYVVNPDGSADVIVGAQPYEEFASLFDQSLLNVAP